MNEQDLKRAFQDVVVASSPPPSMDPGRALDLARKARAKRRSSLVGALVAVLVVGVGLGSAFALNPKGTSEYLTGAGPSSSSGSSTTSSTGMPDTQWGERWPVGQTDRTAHNGPQADRATQLLEVVKAVAHNGGYETPALKYGTPEYQNGDMQRTQAQVTSNKGEKPERWEYTVNMPVRKDGKVGILLAVVSTPNPQDPAEPCALARTFWAMGDADCKVRDVDGVQVGDASSQVPGRVLDWISYRAPNGWVVHLAQSAEYEGGGYPKLDKDPFLPSELAKIAIDPKRLLGS
jgi:hypothetical protein